MRPMLQIQTVPIAIEHRVTRPQMEMRNRPVQLNMDSFEARNSVTPTAMRSIEHYAALGRQSAFNAVGTISYEGTVMLDIHTRESPIPGFAAMRLAGPPLEFNIGWLPEHPVNMDWIPGELHIEYHPDQIDATWHTGRGSFEFIPGGVEFIVTQHPQVIIEFVGEPVYVPPSANPNYEPAVDILI